MVLADPLDSRDFSLTRGVSIKHFEIRSMTILATSLVSRDQSPTRDVHSRALVVVPGQGQS